MNVVTTTDIKEYPLASRGKVRDIYELSPDTLLIVTTDRLSAFDVILPDPIPHKGIILNKITIFWMNRFAGLVKNHLLATDPADFPAPLPPHAGLLRGRAVVVKKARPLPTEFILRGDRHGSRWQDHRAPGPGSFTRSERSRIQGWACPALAAAARSTSGISSPRFMREKRAAFHSLFTKLR